MASQSAPRQALAAAAERRLLQAKPITRVEEELRLKNKRLAFQRLIDPGIVGPHHEEKALVYLKKLQKLAENLLTNPENDKYKRFRTNAPAVKQYLIEPKGVLEYAVQMGFREKAEYYESCYIWNARYEEDLRIGAEVLEAHIALYEDKKELAALDPVRGRVLEEAAIRKVKLQIVEDRIAVNRRKSSGSQAALQEDTPLTSPVSPQVPFRGEGKTLT